MDVGKTTPEAEEEEEFRPNSITLKPQTKQKKKFDITKTTDPFPSFLTKKPCSPIKS